MSAANRSPDSDTDEMSLTKSSQYQLNVRRSATASLADFEYLATSGLISFVQQLLSGEFDQLLCLGAPGTGKSHLCYAVAAEARHQGLSSCVLQLEASQDLNLTNDTSMFDLVVLDDIDQIFNSVAEKALFDFINRAKSLGQRLLMSSGDPGFNCEIDDLRSRLKQGAICHLPKLQSTEDKLAFIQQTLKLRHLNFSNRLCQLIARNGPETSGALNQLIIEIELLLAGKPFKKLSSAQLSEIGTLFEQF